MTSRLRARTVTANRLQFGVLEAGSGPLALCLHGFPDSARTWRYLLPALADAGFHAVAPFMRGYAPTEIPEDGCFGLGALVADAVGLHDVLGGDDRAVLIGSDWGAERFAALWQDGAVGGHAEDRKTIKHPEIGDITVDCDVLNDSDTDLKIVIYTAAPGSEDATKLDLARIAGIRPGRRALSRP